MAVTQKHKGKESLVKRLTAQVGGNKKLAENLLKKRGQMDKTGNLTTKGESRNKMTAGQRAIDRESKKTGKSKKKYKFNAKNNTAVLKKGK